MPNLLVHFPLGFLVDINILLRGHRSLYAKFLPESYVLGPWLCCSFLFTYSNFEIKRPTPLSVPRTLIAARASLLPFAIWPGRSKRIRVGSSEQRCHIWSVMFQDFFPLWFVQLAGIVSRFRHGLVS